MLLEQISLILDLPLNLNFYILYRILFGIIRPDALISRLRVFALIQHAGGFPEIVASMVAILIG